MSNQLQIIEKTKALKRGEKLTDLERLELIQDIREMLERSDVGVVELKHKYGVAYDTANDWRNQALLLMARQDNGLTRDAMRNIQRGQLDHQIRSLTRTLELTDSLDDKLKIHDRLLKYRDALARITGLNSETVTHDIQLKPLQIIRSQADVIDVPNTTDTV